MTKAITDDENGEVICINCGTVIEEKTDSNNESHGRNFEEFMSQTRTGPKNSLTMYDKGMNTIISNKDSNGRALTASNKTRFNRIRLQDSRSKMKKSSQRTLSKSLIFLNGIKEKLGIPELVLEQTAYVYRKAIDMDLARGRQVNSLMGAALYVSCRQTSTPRSLTDIAKVGNMTKKSLQKAVRTLIQKLDLDMPQYDSSSFVTRLSNNLSFDEKTKRFGSKDFRRHKKERTLRRKTSNGTGSRISISCFNT